MNILALLVKNHKWYLHGVGSWHFLLVSFMAITRTSWGLMRKNSAATGRYCKRDCSHHSPFSWYSSRFPQSPSFFFFFPLLILSFPMIPKNYKSMIHTCATRGCGIIVPDLIFSYICIYKWILIPYKCIYKWIVVPYMCTYKCIYWFGSISMWQNWWGQFAQKSMQCS